MCDPILVTLLKMGRHYSQSSRENATPSSGTSPLGSYKEAPPPSGGGGQFLDSESMNVEVRFEVLRQN